MGAMLMKRVTLKQSIIITVIAVILFLACCWNKTLVGFLIVVPLAILSIGMPCVIAIWALRLKEFFKPTASRED